jgi:tetratricopeptide (TPR) repeat protein
MRKAFLYILIIIVFATKIDLFGQHQKLDSLQSKLSIATQDSSRCKIFIEIGDYFEELNPDTALLYYNKCLELAEINGLKNFQATSLRYIGIVYQTKYDYTNALKYFAKAADIEEGLGNNKKLASIFNSIGNIYRNQGHYDKALENYLQSLKIEEDMSNNIGISSCYNNIGNVFLYQGNSKTAIEYFERSLELKQELNDIKGISICYSNLGNANFNVRNLDKALEYYLKALKIDEELGLKKRSSVGYNNIGLIYRNQGQYEKALEYFLKSQKIDEEFGDKHGLAIVYINIGSLHTSLADSTTGSKRMAHLQGALDHGHKGLAVANEIGALHTQSNALTILIKAYKQLGRYNEAFQHVELFNTTRDSMFNQEKAKALVEVQTVYETEKKQQEIDRQQLVIEKHEINIQRQRAQRNFFIAGSFFLFLLLGLILWGYRIKVQNNNIILEKNSLLEQAYEEISAQKDELLTQRDILLTQKMHIEQQKMHITDSIAYAQFIQNAVLPSSDYTNDILGEHFILFKPKDIVSGDFFWTTRLNNWVVVAVADCTGHGVPGAFMSLLGISFLKEIVTNRKISDAGRVLDLLRESIIEALQQKGKSGDQKDGMDIALCMLNFETSELQFAGANNPLLVVTGQKEFQRINPDLQPVSIHFIMKPFTTKTLTLKKGDCIYLATDGYQDQIGGNENKKFMGRSLKEQLLDISHNPMVKQKEILDKTFVNWMGHNEQIDDVTILGIRI